MWKSINGYKGIYCINKKGQIKSEKRLKVDGRKCGGYLIKPSLSNTGYLGVNLTKDGKYKRFHIHRLIMIHFVKNPLKHPCVNHKNGLKTDNRLKNLEWCTYSYNGKDGFKRGRVVWNKGKKGKQKNHNISGLIAGGWNKGIKMKPMIICECGIEFQPPKWSSQFCSKSCASRCRKK